MTSSDVRPSPAPPRAAPTDGPAFGTVHGLVAVGAPAGPAGGGERAWPRRLAPPLLAYLAVMLVQIAMIALLRRPDTPAVGHVLLSWDSRLYLEVAAHGYPATASRDAGGGWFGSNLAFFPLFPALVRAVHELTALSYGDSALTVGRLGGAAAAVLVHQLLSRLYTPRTGLVMVLLTAAQPMGVSLGMGYTEPVFLALAAGALLAAHRQAWLCAGLCGLLAGLTRSTGPGVGAAVAVAAALLPYGAWRSGMPRPIRRWRPLAGALLAGAGTPGYLLWVGLHTGTLDAWFRIQQGGWGTHLDWGADTWDFVSSQFRDGADWVELSSALLITLAVGCTLLALTHRPWPPLAVYGLLVTAMALGQSNYATCKPRMLVPALLFLLPAALALGRARAVTAWSVTTGAVLLGSWYGAGMLTLWGTVI